MDLGLADEVAVVTGSSRGIGLACAESLAREGCRVCLCARNAAALETAADHVRAVAGADRVLAIRADVSTAEGAAHVIQGTVAAFGHLQILVNNVGSGEGTTLMETPDELWHDAFATTLMPAVRVSREAVPHLRARGTGVILMIASIYGRESGGRMTYNAIKAAEISLAKSMARQLAADNIRVNSVAPGSIWFTGGSWDRRQRADPLGIAEFVRRELPFGRFGSVEEVASVVTFLASPRASWISGACVTVDGCQSRSLI